MEDPIPVDVPVEPSESEEEVEELYHFYQSYVLYIHVLMPFKSFRTFSAYTSCFFKWKRAKLLTPTGNGPLIVQEPTRPLPKPPPTPQTPKVQPKEVPWERFEDLSFRCRSTFKYFLFFAKKSKKQI